MDNPPTLPGPAAAPMVIAEAVATLKVRLTRAVSNMNQLRQVGPQEKYLEAYFLVEALDSQLESLLIQQRVHPAG